MTYNYSHYIDDYEAILIDNEPIKKIIRYSQLSEKEVLAIKAKLDSNA
jgi:hypothetical protein